jgi:hypothetical protein
MLKQDEPGSVWSAEAGTSFSGSACYENDKEHSELVGHCYEMTKDTLN